MVVDPELQQGGHMKSAGAQAYNGGLGLCLQWGLGVEPLVSKSGAKPHEAESTLAFTSLKESGSLCILHIIASEKMAYPSNTLSAPP